MGKQGSAKERILDIAERAVLTKGFGATSIEEIVAEASVTKGGFFYHFADKNALARALLDRSIAQFSARADELEARAMELTDDPLQVVLIILKLLAESVAAEDDFNSGSLMSAIVYQERLFDREIVENMRNVVLEWESRRLKFFERIAQDYDMADNVPLESVSAMFNTIFEGAIVHARSTGRPEARSQQILMYRSYLKLLFSRRKDG